MSQGNSSVNYRKIKIASTAFDNQTSNKTFTYNQLRDKRANKKLPQRHYTGQQHPTHSTEILFRVKKGVDGKETQYVFRDDIQFRRIKDWGAGIAQYKCIKSLNSCPARIYHKKGDDNYTYFYVDAHDACKFGHSKKDENNLEMFEFKENLKERVRCGDKAGHAFKDERRNDPDRGAKTRGFAQFKSTLYYHRNKKYGNLPMERSQFGPFLIRSGLDGNYYAQKIIRKDYDANPPDRLMTQWKDRSGKFYIGDGGTHGQYQHFVCKWGAEILGQMSSVVISRISVDLTFKSTPKASPLLKKPLLYDGTMIMWGGWDNRDSNYVPFSIPLTISLYPKAKSSYEEYILGLESLQIAIDKEYKIKIFENDFDIDIMSDLEPALFSACSTKFEADNTLCGFHYCNRIDVNISKKGLSVFTHSNGSQFNLQVHYWVRQYKALMIMCPLFIFRCHNLILSDVKDLIGAAHKACYEFHEYHGGYYMRPDFVLKWNHYRDEQRTNNDQEKGNGDINRFIGPHSVVDEWSYGIATWMNDKYLDYVSYVKKGVQNKRHRSEILKNELLNLVWDYQDEYHEDEHLRIAMKYGSIALKGDKNMLEKILKRKVFYDKNT